MNRTSHEEKPMKRHKILIVDDEPFVRRALERALREIDNTEVIEAESGPKALELIEEHEVHLVISDERMPEMTGVELLKEVKRRHPDVIRIILTGYADIKAAIAAINEGEIYRYLTKPWDADDLLLTVRQALQLYDLLRTNQELRRTVERQIAHLHALERKYPGITKVERDDDGMIVLPGEIEGGDLEVHSAP